MYFRTFKRDNERIDIGPYGFAWYINDILVRLGLVENIDEDVIALIDEGFEEIS